jgi:hypothetical protein
MRFDRYFAQKHNPAIATLSGVTLALTAAIVPLTSSTAVHAQEMDQQTEDAQNVTREEIINQAENFVGQTVTIRGDVVEEQPTGNLFRIANEGLFSTEEILVVGRDTFPTLPEGDVDIQVTGEVRRFVVEDVINELGYESAEAFYADYGDGYTDYENQPVIFAQSIALAPTPDEIGNSPDAFYGRPVAIEGTIGDVVSENIFTLEGGGLFGTRLLVVNPMSMTVPEVGEDVVVTGTIRQFAEAEQDYDYLADAQTQLGVDYQDGPVLYVDGIYPSAE